MGLRLPNAKAERHKDIILDLVPTPETDGTDFETPWVVEHGEQVDASLAGGIEVIGLYVYCADDQFRKLQTKVATVLKRLNNALKPSAPPVVLHLDARAKKSCKSVDMKTVELKSTKVQNNLVRVQVTALASRLSLSPLSPVPFHPTW